MKRIAGFTAALILALMPAAAAWAVPEQLPETFNDWTGDNDDGAAAQLADGSGILMDEPVSTTGTLYGYDGTFDPDQAVSEQVNLTEGEWDINDAQMLCRDGTAIVNAGSSSLVVRNSYVRSETGEPAVLPEGSSGNLLTAGSLRTVLACQNSESIFLNSTAAARNGAALSTEDALPALLEGQKALGVYAFGSETITMEGGYGACAGFLGNLFSYGSHIQAAEIGIICGTNASVTSGTIGDGEKDPVIAGVLSGEDRNRQPDKQLASVIEGGRNALMVYSDNLPAYAETAGCSPEEIPLLSAKINAHGATLRVDGSLDRNIVYESQKQAYINHTKGSAILVKSANAALNLNQCRIVPDTSGTGYLIQTVIHNDTEAMNRVPDGAEYPGIRVVMRDMRVSGDIAHEDYQRDLQLTLAGAALDGAVNEYNCEHWNQAAAQEGFADYAPDTAYAARHGVKVLLQEGSVWTVTKESHLSMLAIGEDCKVEGTIYVDGIEQPNGQSLVYEGEVAVMPAGSETEPAPQEETTVQEETTEEPETETEHVHNWQLDEEIPAACTEDEYYWWACYECGEYYRETVPGTALGHDWQMVDQMPANCDNYGYKEFECSRCGETYIEVEEDSPALGHDWIVESVFEATCTQPGGEVLVCSRCQAEEIEYDSEALGHDFSVCYPTPGEESLSHTVECSRCDASYTEPHTSIGEGYCPVCGFAGAYGAICRSARAK